MQTMTNLRRLHWNQYEFAGGIIKREGESSSGLAPILDFGFAIFDCTAPRKTNARHFVKGARHGSHVVQAAIRVLGR